MRFANLLMVACLVGLFPISMAAQEIRGDYLGDPERRCLHWPMFC